MTHDELLALIDYQSGVDTQRVGWSKQANALRAVVELHKDIEQDSTNLYCKECHSGWEPYPCKTIQAIEKVLK